MNEIKRLYHSNKHPCPAKQKQSLYNQQNHWYEEELHYSEQKTAKMSHQSWETLMINMNV